MPELNEPLSERELEILRLVATGAANKEIAHQLVISPNTVKVHVRNIFDKIGVASRTEATIYAIKIGLVKHQDAEDFAAPGEIPVNFPAEAGKNGMDSAAAAAAPLTENQPEPVQATLPHQRQARFLSRPWLVVLLIFAALILLGGSGILGARLLATPSSPATVTASVSSAAVSNATPAQAVTAPRWIEKDKLPSPRKGMGIVEYENAIYLLGGETSQGIDGIALRYDEAKNNWTALAGKTSPVTEIQAALVGEKIYIPGGLQQDGTPTNRLEVFDPRKNTWERKADLPVPLSAYSLATFEGNLYLFGGKNGERYSAGVYIYSPAENRWNEGTPMSSPRAYAGAIENSGKIYIMGGYDGQKALDLNQAYIPTRDGDGSGESPWKTLAPMPEGRYAMGAAQLASMVFLIGGLGDHNQPPAQAAVQYTIQSNQWTEYEKPPVEVGGFLALLASGNYLYIFGGETSHGLSASNLSYRAIYTSTVPIMINDNNP